MGVLKIGKEIHELYTEEHWEKEREESMIALNQDWRLGRLVIQSHLLLLAAGRLR